MKKSILIFSIIAFTFIACNKTYTCTCFDHFDNVNSEKEIKAKNTDQAIENCGEDINYGTTSKCKLE